MLLSIIAAASENNVIGKDNDLPWDLPDDLKYFRDTTRGKPVIMGRKNYESIAARIGGPLPARRNIIITRQEDLEIDDCDVVHSLDEAIAVAHTDDVDEMFIIGGGQIYTEAMDCADRIYLTRIHAAIEGDVFFPEFDEDEWRLVSEEQHAPDDRHQYAFSFQVYERAV